MSGTLILVFCESSMFSGDCHAIIFHITQKLLEHRLLYLLRVKSFQDPALNGVKVANI